MFYKNTVDAMGHTPLVELARINPNPHVHILAKLEGYNTGGSASVKDRIAGTMIEAAERTGKLKPGMTLLEATSGNTGIALAWLGRQKGYAVTIAMPENMSPERQRLLRLFGAELILTKAAGGVKGSIDLTLEMAERNNCYYLTDQFANPANPEAHYRTTGVEILKDFPYERINYLVCGIGTGGTITGLARRLREKFPDVKIIGVEPPPNDIIQGLRCLEGYIPPVLDLKLVTERSKVTSKEANSGALELLKKEGIFAGQSSGAAAFEAAKLAREIGQGNIVTILPDGGWKYLSMEFWEK